MSFKKLAKKIIEDMNFEDKISYTKYDFSDMKELESDPLDALVELNEQFQILIKRKTHDDYELMYRIGGQIIVVRD